MREERARKIRKDCLLVPSSMKEDLRRLSDISGMDMSDIVLLGAHMASAEKDKEALLQEFRKELEYLENDTLDLLSFRLTEEAKERLNRAKDLFKLSLRAFYMLSIWVAKRFLRQIIIEAEKNIRG